MPETHHEIFRNLLFKNPIIHPSVMILKKSLDGINYNKETEPAEDFDLWTRLIFKGEFYTIQEPLISYRVHDFNVSNIKKDYQKLQHSKLLFNFYKFVNPSISINSKSIFLEFYIHGKIDSLKNVFKLVNLFLHLKKNKLKVNINHKINQQICFVIYEYIKQKLKYLIKNA